MQVVRLDPLKDSRWERLIQATDSSVFHAPPWMRVLGETYGWTPQALVVLDAAGEPVAGVPFVRVEDLRGPRIRVLPFSDHCDPLVRTAEDWASLGAELRREGCPVMVRCLHSRAVTDDPRFAVTKRTKWHGLDLRPTLEEIWQRWDPDKARRAVTKATREGVVVTCGEGEDALRAFFQLHLGIRKHKYQLLAQPYGFFQSIWRHFVEAKQGVLMVAHHGGDVIAAVLYLEWKDTLYYKFSASLPSQSTKRPVDLLVWRGVQYAKERGLTKLDFGLSDWDQEGLLRFKRKFATEEKTIHFLQDDADQPPERDDREACLLLGRLTGLFTDHAVPSQITERAGEVLYRFFA